MMKEEPASFVNGKIDQVQCEYVKNFEFIISEALKENQILAINKKRIAKECRFGIYPGGHKILFHLGKPLILFKPMRIEEKQSNGKFIITLKQEYRKLY